MLNGFTDADVALLLNNSNKPHSNILKLLKFNSHKSEDGEEKFEKINLVHSLLGALRNFCIPSKCFFKCYMAQILNIYWLFQQVSYRAQLIEDETMNTVLPFLYWKNLEIKYKAIGIVRLLIRNSRNGNLK